MKALIVIAVLASLAAAYTPVCQQFRVENFGTPIRTATWQEVKSASVITKVCMVAAWGGTVFVFGSAPWWDNPKVRPWVKVAAGVAVTGLIVGMATSGPSK